MLSKLLFSLVLSVSPIVSVSAQLENTQFDTFQTVDKYLADFDYLRDLDYRVSYVENDDADYSGEPYIFYAFPIYYDIVETYNVIDIYYSNDKYQFWYYYMNAGEIAVNIYADNYVGGEIEMPFLALNYLGMSQVIDNDYTHGYYDDHTIYGSFYKFFTGFFPSEVVAEYHGIFTFVIVAFLLFLVFGFVFFLFRVIRRLVGFK